MIPPAPPRFCRRLRPRQVRRGKSGGASSPAPFFPLAQCGRVLPNPTTVGSAVPLRRSADLKVGDGKIEEGATAVPYLNALGNATCLQAVAPTGRSRHDSLVPSTPHRRASPEVRTVCPAQTGIRATQASEHAQAKILSSSAQTPDTLRGFFCPKTLRPPFPYSSQHLYGILYHDKNCNLLC